MISVAAGLSNENLCFDNNFFSISDIKMSRTKKINLGYMKFKVTMVGLASGVSLGPRIYTLFC